jgi:hypothetical protein
MKRPVRGLLVTLSLNQPGLLNGLCAGTFGIIRSACGQIKFNTQNED